MASLLRRRYITTDPKTGKKTSRVAPRWYGQYRDAGGRTVRVPLSKSRKASLQMLAELERKADLARVGLGTPWEAHAKADLAEHLDAWCDAIRAKGSSDRYARRCRERVAKVIAECKAKRIGDLNAEKVIAAVGRLRAELGLGERTASYYLRDCRSFGRWLEQSDRCQKSPLARAKGKPVGDPGRLRRALAVEDLAALLKAALASQDTFRFLSGRDRYYVYLVAAATGFRAHELSSLTRASFDLAGCTVTIQAGYAKNRKQTTQPIAPDVAQALAPYLADRDPKAAIWGSAWWREAFRMIQLDLAAAGVPYQLESPEGPRYADFHALRHTYVTNVVAAARTVKVAQQLARHSTPVLTMRYTHAEAEDERRAVAALAPSLALGPVVHERPCA